MRFMADNSNRDLRPSSNWGHVEGFASIINIKPPATVGAKFMSTRSTTSGRRLAWVACIQQQDSGEDHPGPWFAMPRVLFP
ncbi:hypothetical protein FOQG_00683 [Fusarium oxysporum f. sp. raphani 54005]|uniref:Uncharacterized protein n=7 Tax=Fusarium oxysporum TaxID=5507 RepID=X0DBQ6_FUSOX|nr:hypothetical protein FOXG_18205 [Fusarium oxysporum f. sp. lycopersici 4287]EWZ44728.1 hypothetical protein FOZG_05366 [Fusarium oxysporum Fo47]EWZ98394.1 hypothetical protein FOWG_02520 [Fusarium oxysporum f. sp. lycopersici MN25]EXA50010.1 hypothetical protein FOVG_02896 [Fusarium oxysporum f. sp. pisi HDV247]EXK42095.1 hypothetical protein FOMG_05196 [Fusarium oxysporum f. sp. melonis 26406]EXL00560.1 hypothetical protein FOQG_00683 [Fusarium oxysporum f. sp. raphani 54005]EXL62054.1 hy